MAIFTCSTLWTQEQGVGHLRSAPPAAEPPEVLTEGVLSGEKPSKDLVFSRASLARAKGTLEHKLWNEIGKLALEARDQHSVAFH